MTKKDDWFDAKMLKIAIGLVTLFLGLICTLVYWGFNKNTTDAVQDIKIQTIETQYSKIDDKLNKALDKLNEIDKKLPDNRITINKEVPPWH